MSCAFPLKHLEVMIDQKSLQEAYEEIKSIPFARNIDFCRSCTTNPDRSLLFGGLMVTAV